MIESLTPDLVLLDIAMPELDGMAMSSRTNPTTCDPVSTSFSLFAPVAA